MYREKTIRTKIYKTFSDAKYLYFLNLHQPKFENKPEKENFHISFSHVYTHLNHKN